VHAQVYTDTKKDLASFGGPLAGADGWSKATVDDVLTAALECAKTAATTKLEYKICHNAFEAEDNTSAVASINQAETKFNR
jgi:hypothetical protein